MKLISSYEALAFLSQSAPRPWVQRLLRWLAFDEGFPAYSRKGRVQAYGTVGQFTAPLFAKAGEPSGPKMDQAIRAEFSEEVAAKLVGRKPDDRLDDDPYTWNESDEPKLLDIGFFLFATDIDWEAGLLWADFLPGSGELHDAFFSDSEFFGTYLESPDFEAEIEGLSFEFSRVEMLLPSVELGQATGFTAVKHDRRKPVGRPLKWDWEGAMAFVTSQANRPDGLPTGPGAQARIETLISDWFMQQVQETPSASQVRQRAAKIMQMIETPKTR